jgi:hypothetical protein
MFSHEIVSCYKDPAELVLFHDVEIKGHIREGGIRWKLVGVFQDRSFLRSKRAATRRLSKSKNTLLM